MFTENPVWKSVQNCSVSHTLWLVLLTLAAVGCSKDIHVNLKPDGAEVGQPTADLVRSVEVRYQDPQAHEKMRQRIPVMGLNQPMSVDADLFKDVDWEKGGTFSAIGFSADEKPILAGAAKPDPDATDLVEITLGRVGGLSSPYLRTVRLTQNQKNSDYRVDAILLNTRRDQEGCVSLPTLVVAPEQGYYPMLVFEGEVKAPRLFYSVGAKLADVGTAAELPVLPSAEVGFELGPQFLNGALIKEDTFATDLHLYSGPEKTYEGCLHLESQLQRKPLQPLRLSFEPQGSRQLGSVARLWVSNPNPNAVSVQMLATVQARQGPGRVIPYFVVGERALSSAETEAQPRLQFEAQFEVPAQGRQSILFFGGLVEKSCLQSDMMRNIGGIAICVSSGIEARGLQLDWQVQLLNGVGGGDASHLSPQQRSDFLP